MYKRNLNNLSEWKWKFYESRCGLISSWDGIIPSWTNSCDEWLIHPCIHPFCCADPRSGAGGSRLSSVLQTSLSPAPLPSSSWRVLRLSPGQMGYLIPPVSSGSAPRSSPSWTCLENLQWKAPSRHPDGEWLMLIAKLIKQLIGYFFVVKTIREF